MITLHELLASRDARHATQQKLLAEHSGKTLVCLTVVMPGSVKRNHQSLCAAHAAVEAMREAFHRGCAHRARPRDGLRSLSHHAAAAARSQAHSGNDRGHAPAGQTLRYRCHKLRRHTCRKKRYRRKTTPLSRLRTRSTLLHEDALAHAGGDMGEDKRDGRPLH